MFVSPMWVRVKPHVVQQIGTKHNQYKLEGSGMAVFTVTTLDKITLSQQERFLVQLKIANVYNYGTMNRENEA